MAVKLIQVGKVNVQYQLEIQYGRRFISQHFLQTIAFYEGNNSELWSAAMTMPIKEF